MAFQNTLKRYHFFFCRFYYRKLNKHQAAIHNMEQKALRESK